MNQQVLSGNSPSTQRSIMQIRTWYNDGDLLVGDDAEQYNLDASCGLYETLVFMSLETAYPDAEIEIVRNRNLTGWCRSTEVDGRSDTWEAASIDDIISGVYQSYDWLVEN